MDIEPLQPPAPTGKHLTRHAPLAFGLWLLLVVIAAPGWVSGPWYLTAAVLALTLWGGLAALQTCYSRGWLGIPSRSTLFVGAAACGIITILLALLAPRYGLETTVQTEQGVTVARKAVLPGVRPTEWLSAASVFESAVVNQKGWVTIPESGPTVLQFSTTHGGGRLFVDDREVGRIETESPDRNEFVFLDGKPGLHQVSFEIHYSGPLPSIGLQLAEQQGENFIAADSRFYFSPEPSGAGVLVAGNIMRALCWFAGGLTFLLFCAGFKFHPEPRPSCACLDSPQGSVSLAAGFLILLSLLLAVCFHGYSIQKSGGVLDADEAAFGIMAERLLDGELPPLFHYGQNYQGTFEAWTLAFVFKLFGVSAQSLKWHAFCWYLLGMALILILAAREFRLGELAWLGAYLAISPQFLSWFSTKAWFGYDATWAMGAAVLVLTVSLARNASGRDWRWAMLGFLAGFGFYTLPIIVPFLVTSAVVLLRTTAKKLIGRTGLLVIAGLAMGLVPMIVFDLATGGLASEFVREGRVLGAPRLPGERPFIDRFLGECVPVLLGARAVHEDQYEHIPYALALVIYVLAALGIPDLARRLYADAKAFWKQGVSSIHFVFALLAIFTTILVVYGPFGIWPWYAWGVYPLLILSIAAGIRMLGRVLPAAVPLMVVTVLFGNAYGTLSTAAYMHQPTSLLKQGILLAQDHSELLDTLDRENIEAVLCDQGMDIPSQGGGRDWIGERITFESEGRINGIDVFSRRHHHLAERLHHSPRIAYLFHRNFLWWDNNHRSDSGYIPMDRERMDTLFGPRFADYKRIETGPYVLFVPRAGSPAEEKCLHHVAVTVGYFPGRMVDGEIGSREMGPAYWASGNPEGQRTGDSVTVDLGEMQPVRRLVLYHGVKGSDRPRRARVELSTDASDWKPAGYVDWYADPNASIWESEQTQTARYIRIVLEETTPEAWLTVYEVWVL